jgi:C4-dicarboxylate transporter DctM subunit
MAFRGCVEIIGLVILVLGGLIIGWFTPTEAEAVGAFGAIVFSMFRRRLNWQKFRQSIRETVKLTGMLYAIIIGAMLFKYFIAMTTIPTVLGEYVAGLTIHPLAVRELSSCFIFSLVAFLRRCQ